MCESVMHPQRRAAAPPMGLHVHSHHIKQPLSGFNLHHMCLLATQWGSFTDRHLYHFLRSCRLPTLLGQVLHHSFTLGHSRLTHMPDCCTNSILGSQPLPHQRYAMYQCPRKRLPSVRSFSMACKVQIKDIHTTTIWPWNTS